MLKLPPYAAVAIPIWLVALIVLIIVLPLNGWWEPLAPTQYAAFVLREASFVPVKFGHDSGCEYPQVRAWLRLERHPQGEGWFDRVLRAHPTPAGRILAEAGRRRLIKGQHVGPWPIQPRTSVRILSDTGWSWWAPVEAQDELDSGRLGEHMDSAGPCLPWGIE